MAKEEHDHPVESSEILTLAGPEAPVASELSTPKLGWKYLITPIGTVIFGTVLALGHHAFNAWADGRIVARGVVPQHWVTLIGVGFSFGFKSAVGAMMGFVLLQSLWLSVTRQPLTIQQINTMYRIERQDQLYQTLPHAFFFSPTIVVFSVLTLLLPLSSVFAPGSLSITTQNSTHVGPCMVPTGNLSTRDLHTPDYASLFNINHYNVWQSPTPRATTLAAQCLVTQRIPDLPHACGPDCRYKVSVPSFAFQCTPNPPLLPYGQQGLHSITLWNGTTDPTSKWAFYVAWKSDGGPGTWGNASCSPVQAQYDIEVMTKGGVQSITTRITQTTSPIPDVTDATLVSQNDTMLNFWSQLASISYATQALFLGSVSIVATIPGSFKDTRLAGQPSFLHTSHNSSFAGAITAFTWGDVLKGIEEMSHNITAALLTLSLGTMSENCSFDQQLVVYQYNSSMLWIPYGTALGIALISLVVAVMIMATNNTGDITTSFSDTVILTRNVDRDVSSGAKLWLSMAENGNLGYTLV